MQVCFVVCTILVTWRPVKFGLQLLGIAGVLLHFTTFPEVGMWPPKRWEIESGHIRISSLVQGERRIRLHFTLMISSRFREIFS
jgi:hypothetical protein